MFVRDLKLVDKSDESHMDTQTPEMAEVTKQVHRLVTQNKNWPYTSGNLQKFARA